MGKGEPGTKSMECFTWQCIGTPIGEAKISLCSSTIFSTSFYWVERSKVEVVVAAVAFHSPPERFMKKTNIEVWEITLQHCFVEINEMEVVTTTSSTL
jgi:hypothetical protein